MKRLLIIGNVLAVSFIIVYGCVNYAAPLVASQVWREDYKGLMFRCDHAMREHYIAKRAVSLNTSEDTIKNLQASEVGLLDCHEYDKIRKRMLVWGVSNHMLSTIGLEALEEKAYELRRFVEIHEIRY